VASVDGVAGNGELAGDHGRRDALKKIGLGAAGAAAVWAAPSVLSVTAAAAASGGGGGGGGGCVGCGIENVLNGGFENTIGPAPLGAPFELPADWTVIGDGIVFPYAAFPSNIAPPVGGGQKSGADYDSASVLSQSFSVDSSCWGHPYVFQFQAWSLAQTSTALLQFADGSSGANDVSVTIGPAQTAAPSVYYPISQSGTIPVNTTSVAVTFRAGVQLGVDLVSFIIGC